MKYRHYAPKANLIIVSGEADAVVMRINELTGEYRKKAKRSTSSVRMKAGHSISVIVIESIGSRSG